MEDIERITIPTLSRTRIGRHLSYPIGAERISSALASVAHLADLKLHFYFWSDHGLRWGDYEFLRVEYLNNAKPAEEWPLRSLYKRPPQYRWEIVVQPVPRLLRHRIQQYIIESALPQVAHWLVERADLKQQGSDILAFFYDEKKEEFTPRHLSRLEPLRARHK